MPQYEYTRMMYHLLGRPIPEPAPAEAPPPPVAVPPPPPVQGMSHPHRFPLPSRSLAPFLPLYPPSSIPLKDTIKER